MEPLTCPKGDDVLEALLLEATDNKPEEFPTLVEEATLLGEDPTTQEIYKTTTCPPDHPEVTSESTGAVRVVEPQNAWEQMTPPPLGFRQPTG